MCPRARAFMCAVYDQWPRALRGSSKMLGESSSNIEALFVAAEEGFRDFFVFGFDGTSANMSSSENRTSANFSVNPEHRRKAQAVFVTVQ